MSNQNYNRKTTRNFPAFVMAFIRSKGLHSQVALERNSNSDEGLTLIECVVAIVVIAVIGAMITPPLFIAAATRVQNRRAEEALQVAQGEIDRVRALVEQGAHDAARLPAEVASIDGVAAPTVTTAALKSSGSCPGTVYDPESHAGTVAFDQALRVDINGDCETDYLLQTFREQGAPTTANLQTNPTRLRTGVRVYAALRNTAAGATLAGLQTRQAELKFTTGRGFQETQPLAVLYSTITWGDRDFSLCELQVDQATDGRTCS